MRIISMTARENAVHFELDKGTRVLSASDGSRWSLGHSEFEVLSRLAGPPIAPVATEELLDVGWKHPDRQLESVARTIADLRKKLGDTQPVKRFIATIPRFGYELIADCEHKEASALLQDTPTIRTDAAETPDSKPQTGRTHTRQAASAQYSAGDWITAAIVGRGRATTELKKVAAITSYFPAQNSLF